MTAKARRRRTRRLLPKKLKPTEKDMVVAWLPIGMKGGGAGRAVPRMLSGWKSVEITGNDVDLKHLGKAQKLIIRNIVIHTIGNALVIEGK